jgi:atypical dual specificity phosphatase
MSIDILPSYPRTLHLPWKPNTQRGDLVASEKDVSMIFNYQHVYIEEKVDGSPAGIARVDGHPMIRNRDHILRKGYQKSTPAKMQFASIWNWFYSNEKKFEKLSDIYPTASVYGEWMYAVHGMVYNKLPSLFIAYDLYDYTDQHFVRTDLARAALESAGFCVVPLLHKGPIEDYVQLETMTLQPSNYADAPREGIYVKVSEGKWVDYRFKMVRQGFVQGSMWSPSALQRNILKKD